ncbi:peroxisome biogenesis protein [Trifolium repens]|nr:peroxisome biogenesis protein [Trifolium repens]
MDWMDNGQTDNIDTPTDNEADSIVVEYDDFVQVLEELQPSLSTAELKKAPKFLQLYYALAHDNEILAIRLRLDGLHFNFTKSEYKLRNRSDEIGQSRSLNV